MRLTCKLKFIEHYMSVLLYMMLGVRWDITANRDEPTGFTARTQKKIFWEQSKGIGRVGTLLLTSYITEHSYNVQ